MNRLVYCAQVSKVQLNQLLGLLWTTLTLAVTVYSRFSRSTIPEEKWGTAHSLVPVE